jgi:hypothetical protein
LLFALVIVWFVLKLDAKPRDQKSRSRTDSNSFFSIFWNRPAAAQL